MPKQANAQYYAALAIVERRRGQAAADARLAAIHAELSARYDALSSDPRFGPPAFRRATG